MSLCSRIWINNSKYLVTEKSYKFHDLKPEKFHICFMEYVGSYESKLNM